MKKFHPGLTALTSIGSTVRATVTRADTRDIGYQGRVQYAPPLSARYAHPYDHQYGTYRYAHPYHYQYGTYRYSLEYATLYKYRYARPYAVPAYKCMYSRAYAPRAYYDYATGGY
jgi:hypothetical protein